MSTSDIAWVWWMIGFIMGNAICYFTLVRPMMKLKDKYIEELRNRIKNGRW